MVKHCKYNQMVNPTATILLSILVYLLEHTHTSVGFGVKLLCCVVLHFIALYCIKELAQHAGVNRN